MINLTVENLDRFKEYLSRKQEQRLGSTANTLQPKQLRKSLGGQSGAAAFPGLNGGGQQFKHKQQRQSSLSSQQAASTGTQMMNQHSFEGFIGQLLKNSKPIANAATTAASSAVTPKSERRSALDSVTGNVSRATASTPQQRRLQQPESPIFV